VNLIVAIYVRVSTDDQKPENQVKELVDFCHRVPYTIFDTYIDKCSGLKDSRPEFNRLLQDMRQRKFDAILVWKLDRIGRSLQHLLQLLHEMKERKVEFICLTQNIDTTTSSGRLLFSMMGAFAEFESSLISERTKAGMNRAKSQGIHCGRPRKRGGSDYI
jgi:DNA invertase Pin-like site-specific DNA recombinase